MKNNLIFLIFATGICASFQKDLRLTGEDSCVGRCDEGLNPDAPCQCNEACQWHDDCCSDYYDVCQGGSTDDLKDLTERLLELDSGNVGSKVVLNLQGNTESCSTSDKAPEPLFTTVDDSVWTNPTIKMLVDMFENYHPDVQTEEDLTPEQLQQQDDFLDAVLESDVMVEAFKYLQDKNIFTGSPDDFRAKLYELWFDFYDRDGDNSVTTYGSNGFEHVFVGEMKEGKVSGFHNWVHFYKEEEAGRINYFGQLAQASFGEKGQGVSEVYKWNGKMKCFGSMMVGTSPELDMTLYSLCILIHPNGKCRISLGGAPVTITTYTMNQNGKTHIGTAYPDF